MVGDLEEAVGFVVSIHLIDCAFDHVWHELIGRNRNLGGEVLRKDLLGGGLVGPLDLDLHVETARAQNGRVDEIFAVCGTDDDDVAQALDAVDLCEQLRHDGALHVGTDTGAASSEHAVHLVEKYDDGPAFFALFAGPLKHETNLPFGFADVLVEQFGPLDVDEVTAALVSPSGRCNLLRQAVGHGLGNEGFAAARRAIEQDALGRWQTVLGKEFLIQVRKFDSVGDLLDLRIESANVGIGDIGYFLEQQIFDLGAGQLLEQHVGSRIHAQRIAGP